MFSQQNFLNNAFDNPDLFPLFQENNIAIAFASDNNYVAYLAVALQSVLLNCSDRNNYDIVILSDNISPRNRSLIQQMSFGLKNVGIRFYECSNLLNQEQFQFHNQRLSRSTFSRLYSIDIFRNYQKILYLDCDIVVLEDIANLYSTNIQDNYIGGVSDIYIETVRQIDSAVKEHLDTVVNRKSPYFNAGVLLLNIDALKRNFTSQYFINTATSRQWMWEDQDVLNKITEGNTFFLPNKWNVLYVLNDEIFPLMKKHEEFRSALEQPKLMHFAGGILPPKHKFSPWAEPFWQIARQTPFYEQLLIQRMSLDIQSEAAISKQIEEHSKRHFERLFDEHFEKCFQKHFPEQFQESFNVKLNEYLDKHFECLFLKCLEKHLHRYVVRAIREKIKLKIKKIISPLFSKNKKRDPE